MIKIEKITKIFGEQKVLNELDLYVEDKKTLVIIGRSGCGKSVLLKHMNGLIKPDSGSILFRGRDITKLSEEELDPIRVKSGMLFQSAALFDSLRSEERRVGKECRL